jgi:hypothetical protein
MDGSTLYRSRRACDGAVFVARTHHHGVRFAIQLRSISKPYDMYRLFFCKHDISLKRLLETTYVCGTVPRRCFQYSISEEKLDTAKNCLKAAIDRVQDLAKAIQNVHGNFDFPHRIFEIYPRPIPISRHFDLCQVRPLSKWVLDRLMAEKEQREKDVGFKFYQSIQATMDASAFRGRIWEWQVHKYFRSITSPTVFQAHSLDNRVDRIVFSLSDAMQHKDFGPIQAFQGELASCVRIKKPCYLKPISKTFAAIDSIFYLPDFATRGLRPIIACQMTDSSIHHINRLGLATLQRSFKTGVPELNCLRPLVNDKWILLFIVPAPTGSAFTKQSYVGSGTKTWGTKVAQYVLELDPKEVWKA